MSGETTGLTVTVALPKLTPAQLAVIFWSMDDAEQGRFFDELGSLVLSTPAPFSREIGSMIGLDMQMYFASKKATALGQDVMRRIHENGKMWLNPNYEAEQESIIAGFPNNENSPERGRL